MKKEEENFKKNEIEILRIDLLNAYRAYFNDDDKLKNLSNNYTTYENHPFFHELASSINEQLKIGDEFSPRFFRDFFYYSERIQPSRKNNILRYIKQAPKPPISIKNNKANSSNDSIHFLKTSYKTLSSSSNSNTNINEQLNGYFKKIQLDFKILNTGIPNFKLPVKKIIRINLKKEDLDLKKQLVKLENKRKKIHSELQSSSNKLKKIDRKIDQINNILNIKHNIIDVIKAGGDVFIESYAGSGKSTLLKWLVFHFATNYEKYYIPIFIELIFVSSDDLETIIKENCYNLDFYSVKKEKLILFLDGFDEFIGNKLKLFKEIRKLKKQKNLQIVFTGRQKPNLLHLDFHLAVYHLDSLSKRKINTFCRNYLGKKDGTFFFKYIIEQNLSNDINVPLYLSFLLVQIKRLRNLKHKKSEIIKDLNIRNKGRLIYDVIVEYFIKSYEHKISNPVNLESWKNEKRIQLEFVKYLAFYITIKRRNSETIEWDLAMKLLEKRKKKTDFISRLESHLIIDQFIKHDILKLKNGILSFQKKQLRIFFTALYLKDKIFIHSDFEKYNKKFTEINNQKLWFDIQNFLSGLINSKSIFQSIENIRFNNPLQINLSLINFYTFYLNCIDQKNIPDGYKVNYALIKNTIYIIVETIKPNKKFEIEIKKHGFIANICMMELKLNLLDILKIIELSKMSYIYSNSILEIVLKHNKATITLNLKEKIKIYLAYLFKTEDYEKYITFFNYTSDYRKMNFFNEIGYLHGGEFFNEFFKELSSFPPYRLKRFIIMLLKDFKYYTIRHRQILLMNFFFHKNNLLKQNADVIFQFIKNKYLVRGIYIKNLKISLISSTDRYFKNLFLNYFKEIIKEKEAELNEKENAKKLLYEIQNKIL